MIYPDLATFKALTTQGNFVPIYQEWVADLDTPVSAWCKVCAGQPYSFLLESVEGGENIGRYSLLGCDPLWTLESRHETTIQRFRDGTMQTFTGNPFEILASCLEPYKPVKLPELPPGIGGLFGFWGYELIKWIEPTVTIHAANDDNDLPDGLWMQVDSLLIFDQVKRKIWAISYADLRDPTINLEQAYSQSCDRITNLVNKLSLPLSNQDSRLAWTPPSNNQAADLSYTSNRSKDEFCKSVETAKDHIKAGDIFQVVISQRLTTDYSGNPFDLYRSLRLVNPSPYMAYFNFQDWQIIGSSPEVMVKATREGHDNTLTAVLRPIAGTRPRGKTTTEDNAYAEDLLV